MRLSPLLPFLCLTICPCAFAIFPWPVSSATAESAAYIVWTTDVPGTSQVEYGPTSSYGSAAVLDPTPVTYHTQTVTGLSPDSLYHFRVISTDSRNITVHSEDYTFRTLATPTGNVKRVVAAGGGDYASISACAAAAQPGWTCEVYSGTYNEVVAVRVSGTAESPITFLAQGDAKVENYLVTGSYVNIRGFEITNSTPANLCSLTVLVEAGTSATATCSTLPPTFTVGARVFLEGNAPAKWNGAVKITRASANSFGFAASPGLGEVTTLGTASSGSNGITLGTTSGAGNIRIESNFLHEPCGLGIRWSFQIPSNYVAVRGNLIERPGYYCGGAAGIESWGDYNLFDGNDISHANHYLEPAGAFNVIRRNVFHDSDESEWGMTSGSQHIDAYHPLPSKANPIIHHLIENNQEYNTNIHNAHFLLIDDTVNPPGASHDVVVRFNTVINVGSYFLNTSSGGVSGIRLYNNTVASLGIDRQRASISYTHQSPGGVVLNNILEDTVVDGGYVIVTDDTSDLAKKHSLANNLLYNRDCAGGCSWPHLSPPAAGGNPILIMPGLVYNRDPNFASPRTFDFSLRDTSPALNKGTFLTTVAAADSGAGTSLVVVDAGFFQDGYGGIVTPDCIAVGEVSNSHCIAPAGINYEENTITLVNPMTRSRGDKVWLYSDSAGRRVLTGSAPNIGARVGP